MNCGNPADCNKTLDELLDELADTAKTYGREAYRRELSQNRLSDDEVENEKKDWDDDFGEWEKRIQSLKKEIKKLVECKSA